MGGFIAYHVDKHIGCATFNYLIRHFLTRKHSLLFQKQGILHVPMNFIVLVRKDTVVAPLEV